MTDSALALSRKQVPNLKRFSLIANAEACTAGQLALSARQSVGLPSAVAYACVHQDVGASCAGFPVSFLSGFSVAAGRAGCPDTGLLSFAEVLDSARCAVEVGRLPKLQVCLYELGADVRLCSSGLSRALATLCSKRWSERGGVASQAAPGVAIIADGDTGYGNAMNVKRTVRGFANAGLAGVLIEDQVQAAANSRMLGSASRHAAVVLQCNIHRGRSVTS
jgi:Phosphoenolpyruvate phosphomutase